MNWKKYICLLMLSMMIAIVPRTAIRAEAGVSKETVKKAYEKYANKHAIEYYEQKDIDGNGIKEMLYYGNGNKVGVCSYNTKKKKVVAIKSVNIGKGAPIIYTNKKKHSVFMLQSDTGGHKGYAVKIKGTGKIKTTKLVFKWGRKYGKKEETITTINGRKVSNKKYQKRLKTYLKWKAIPLDSYPNP